ncbi:putative mfs protein [Paramyrothecium foliicola]|nr:putative mfs protein [Paramyrothecium foliicola]
MPVGTEHNVEAGLSDTDAEATGSELERTTTATSPFYTLPLWRKSLIVFSASITTLCVSFASTSLFPLTAEISASLNTSQGVIIASNAILILIMGLSGFIWGPLGRIMGRKPAWIAASLVFALTTVGAALAPRASAQTRLNIFLAMRVLSGFEGTTFHVMGQMYITEVFVPTQRGTAAGFFFIGTVFGPAFGPCVSGVMVTYLHWTSILWLQVGMMGAAIVLSILVLPKIPAIRQASPRNRSSKRDVAMAIIKEFDPTHVFRVLVYPNVTLTDIACSLTSWVQYTLLAAPRHLLNPRFNLTTPLVSGLFYIAPGLGFMIGTVVGGKFSDITVIKWIEIRGGVRLPQDRLNSGLIAFFFVIPVASLIYGWGLEYEVGGLALPIISAFFCGVGVMLAFTSLNTYCAEVMPRKRAQVIASKYLFQYSLSAVGSGVMVPLIDAIGIGPAQTLGVAFVIVAGFLTWITAKYGLKMQHWVEEKMKHSGAKEVC